MPKISVIVPVYKVEAYLSRCVSSILSQTYGDFELILVDDGSPDRCGDLCEEYARQDPRVHVIHQENGGLSAARNAGIDWAFENSDSEYLTFVDSDDWVAQDYLEQLFRAVRETGCAISAGNLLRTAGEPLPEAAYSLRLLSAEDYYCKEGAVTAVAVCKLYRKSLFDTQRYPLGKLHEDEFTTYILVYGAGSVAAVSAPLYAYYQNPESIMRSKWNPRRIHALEAMEQQLQFAKEKGLPRLKYKVSKQYVFNCSNQLQQIIGSAEHRDHRRNLEKKLRFGLKAARTCGSVPFGWESLWAYELAYPMRAVWWLVFKIKARIGR